AFVVVNININYRRPAVLSDLLTVTSQVQQLNGKSGVLSQTITQADAQMRSLAQQKPNDPEQVYAYGLYLSGSDRDRAALAHLNT
ncbi:hypothetical protein MJI37_34235, partial [Salmonella enterica subsp. enterica serovar Cerro]|nr:hypothetical protein [Salmonella enterica subsp. enterica serovar Cerro]